MQSTHSWMRPLCVAQDLIRQLLVADERERLTAQQVLAHPWAREHAASHSGSLYTHGASDPRPWRTHDLAPSLWLRISTTLMPSHPYVHSKLGPEDIAKLAGHRDISRKLGDSPLKVSLRLRLKRRCRHRRRGRGRRDASWRLGLGLGYGLGKTSRGGNVTIRVYVCCVQS